MAGFGDFSDTTKMRGGVIPAGGLHIDTGCWTQGSDVTAYIPTQLTEIVAFVCGSASPDESPDISGSFLRCSLTGTSSGKILNYIAVGW